MHGASWRRAAPNEAASGWRGGFSRRWGGGSMHKLLKSCRGAREVGTQERPAAALRCTLRSLPQPGLLGAARCLQVPAPAAPAAADQPMPDAGAAEGKKATEEGEAAAAPEVGAGAAAGGLGGPHAW